MSEFSNRRPPHMDAIGLLVEGLGGSTSESNADLAKKMNLSLRTFTRALAAADGFGVIVIEYRRSSGRGDIARTIRLPQEDASNGTALEVAS